MKQNIVEQLRQAEFRLLSAIFQQWSNSSKVIFEDVHPIPSVSAWFYTSVARDSLKPPVC